jgi:hypothetical protein
MERAVARLDEDTAGDKLVRFVIGAFLGAVTAWYLATRWYVVEAWPFAVVLVSCAVVVGVVAAAFGNGFIERFIRGRWWE